MSDAALLATIRAAQGDDAPRLVYADWLDEHGQPERAEFIRVQCELARTPSSALRQREAQLLTAHHDSFAASMAAPGVRYTFKRGFITGFGHTGFFVSDAPVFVSDTPVDRQDWSFFSFKSRGVATEVRLRSQSARSAAEFIQRVAQPHTYLFQYLLTAFGSTAEIRIFRRDDSLDFRGLFRGATLSLENYRGFNEQPTHAEFSHVHLDDFHSLQET